MQYSSEPRPPRDAHWLPRKEYLALKMRSAMLGTSPTEMVANKVLGYDPAEVRHRGVIGTMGSSVVRALLGVQAPRAQMTDRLEEPEENEAQEDEESRKSAKQMKKFMRRQLKATESLNRLLKQLLNEAVLIRKVVEGRVKFRPKAGAYTKELTTREIKKRERAGLKGPTSSFVSLAELLTPIQPTPKNEGKPWERAEDPNNENKDRTAEIAPAVKAGFTSSSIDEMTPEALEPTAPQPPKPSGIGTELIGATATGLMTSLLTRGVLKRGAKSAATTGAAVGAKVGAKVAAKGMAKTLLKKLPVIGLVAGLGYGAKRMMEGDLLGAVGEAASGAASLAPGIGTAASLGIDAALLGRDMQQSAVQSQIGRSMPDTASPLEQDIRPMVPPITPVAPQVVNNVFPNTQTPNQRFELPDVRTTSNSFIRFQDSRQARVV